MATATIVNVSTGEIITRELTAEEEAVEAKRAADKASGDAKLKALGLTDDEIAAR